MKISQQLEWEKFPNDLNRVFKSHDQNILIKTKWNLYEVNSQTQPQPHYLYNIKGGFFEHFGYFK